jgi:predicted phage terminase large subunit-like protein
MRRKSSFNEDDFFLACRHDFPTFVGFVFSTLAPNAQYLHNWHIDAMAEQLRKCHAGECKRLIVTMPPRMLKSIVMSVAYPAWVLGHNPSAEVMCISYGDELVRDLGDKSLALMQSPRYHKVFPNVRLQQRRQSAAHIGVIGGGRRLGISAGGAITGRGANVIIIDDPLKASDARTKQREVINSWFDENIYQRLNNKNEGVIILVMQRLHLFDLAGYLLDKPEPWTHMNLPAIAECDDEYELPGGNIYQRKTGDILHPKLESQEKLDLVKQNQGAYVFAAQYQQQPASDKDSLVRREWFKIDSRETFPKANQFSSIYISWDTANNVGESNDYSVGVVIGYVKKEFYVLDVIRQKLRFPELLRLIEHKQIYQDRKLVTLVEDAASGQAIIQELRHMKYAIHAVKPENDKFMRLSAVSGYIESGLVHVPAGASWLDDFLLEITSFPNSPHDDQVDAFSQAMLFIIHSAGQGIKISSGALQRANEVVGVPHNMRYLHGHPRGYN